MTALISRLFKLDQQIQYLRTVAEPFRSYRARFFGISEGERMSILFAATYPIRVAVASLGLSIRVGLHAGECEVMDKKVTGIAVQIWAG